MSEFDHTHTEKLCPLTDWRHCSGEHCECPLVPPVVAQEVYRLRDELARVYTAIGQRAISDLLAAPQPGKTTDDLAAELIQNRTDCPPSVAQGAVRDLRAAGLLPVTTPDDLNTDVSQPSQQR